MKTLPSIFNDVIGPVMRGPSSSHTAASWRVARMAIQMLNEPLAAARIEFDRAGAWATNYEEQGTVWGMDGGLLGIDMADDQMKETAAIAKDRGVDISYAITSFENFHANSMLLSLTGQEGATLQILAASLGGGSFEIQKIDGVRVSMQGDFYSLLVRTAHEPMDILASVVPDSVSHHASGAFGDGYLAVYRSSAPMDPDLIRMVESREGVTGTAVIVPIMPVVSGKETLLLFRTSPLSSNSAKRKA